MTIGQFFNALLAVINAMSPYLLLGFLIAGILHVFVPKTFYAKYLSRDNKLSVLWAALLGVPLPLCSCGVIPTAVGLKNEGASKGAVASFLIATPQTGIDSILATFSLMGLGFAITRPVAALVMLMAGPAVNIASILVVRKSMGRRFTWIYLLTIVGFSVLFGLLINTLGISAIGMSEGCGMHSACCPSETASPNVFQIICSSLLVLFIIIALSMKFFSKFKKQETAADTVVYTVEGMHCNHCKAACEQSVGKVKGVASCEATPAANTLVVTGTASADNVRKAVEQAGFEFKGVKE